MSRAHRPSDPGEPALPAALDVGARPAGPGVDAALRAYVASRVPAQEVDDVVQDVLLRWLDHAGAIPREALEAWLVATARRRTIDWLRGRGRALARNEEDLDALAERDAAPDALAALAGCLGRMLDALDPEDRALLARVDGAGASQADLARELGLSPSGARARVQRARGRLREVFDACCEFETDRRGGVVDWRRRAGTRVAVAHSGCGLPECGPSASCGEASGPTACGCAGPCS